MNREELGRAIKAACANLDEPRVIVFGSQSILGSYDDSELPPAAIASREVDILPLSGITDPPSVEEKLLLIDAQLGEDSPFHDYHGFYVEGIHKDVVVLPLNWENRLVHFTVDDDASQLYGRTGLCLDPVDLCVSKTLAGRPKDREFVAALVRENIVHTEELLRRLAGGIDWPPGYLAESQTMLDRAQGWLEHLATPPDGANTTSTDPAVIDAVAAAVAGHPRSVKHLLTPTADQPDPAHHEPDHAAGRDTGTDLSR